MKTKVIIMVEDTMDCSEELAKEYYQHDGKLDDFVGTIRERYPQAVCEEPIEEDIQGDIMEQTDRYVLTDEQHNMGETMRIYEKMD